MSVKTIVVILTIEGARQCDFGACRQQIDAHSVSRLETDASSTGEFADDN